MSVIYFFIGSIGIIGGRTGSFCSNNSSSGSDSTSGLSSSSSSSSEEVAAALKRIDLQDESHSRVR